MSKLPLTVKTPEAPANLPVPPVIFAVPLKVTVAGAESESAHPCDVESKTSVNVFPPPLMTPLPSKPSH